MLQVGLLRRSILTGVASFLSIVVLCLYLSGCASEASGSASSDRSDGSEEFDALIAAAREEASQSPPSTTPKEAEELRACAGDAVDFLVVSGKDPQGDFTDEMRSTLYECLDQLGLRERLSITLSDDDGDLDGLVQIYNNETQRQLECLKDNGVDEAFLTSPDNSGYIHLEWPSEVTPDVEALRSTCL